MMILLIFILQEDNCEVSKKLRGGAATAALHGFSRAGFIQPPSARYFMKYPTTRQLRLGSCIRVTVSPADFLLAKPVLNKRT